MHKISLFTVLMIFLLNINIVYAVELDGINQEIIELPAFPGAEGLGAIAAGGRYGEVYEVTNLHDSGSGSLREAVSQENRTVVFNVSGTIELESQLRIQGNITIAGQTAPGAGICVKGYPTAVVGDNVIIRYMRFRLGADNGRHDTFNINYQKNIIIDHCSFSWGVDEVLSAYSNENITIQWSMVGEGLNNVNHSCGGLWGASSSYHHNLIYHNKTRSPKFAYLGGKVDFRNNVIYNWQEMSIYTGSKGQINMVGNYFKPGPSTLESAQDILIKPGDEISLYLKDNFLEGNETISSDNWQGVYGSAAKVDTPFSFPEVATSSSQKAYQDVILEAGASLPERDAVDKRIVNDVINGTGAIINYPSDVGGWPVLRTGVPPLDSDHDGMPDYWEVENGLNSLYPGDRNGDQDNDGYTNLEEYLNYLIIKLKS